MRRKRNTLEHSINRCGLLTMALLALGFIGAGGFSVSVAYAAPAPKINALSVDVVQRGVTTKLIATGSTLNGIERVVVDGLPGISAKVLASAKPSPSRVTIELQVKATAKPSTRQLRLIGPGGASNAMDIHVRVLPILREREPNNTAAAPQAVNLPGLLVGKIQSGSDNDRFLFDAIKGDHLVFDIEAFRIGSALAPVLMVHDAATGKPVAFDEPVGSIDRMMIFHVPANGKYILSVRDIQYRGGGNYQYLIRAGAIPHVDSVLPLAGKRGAKVKVQLTGFNLKDASMVEVDLTDAQPGMRTVGAKTVLGHSNPLAFEVSELDESVEVEPNGKQETATPIVPGSAVSGSISQRSDRDYYVLKIEKKQKLTIRVKAQTYGSPLDVLLRLFDAKGNQLQINDDSGSADALITRNFEPGTYYLKVVDLLRGGSRRHVYRISVSAGSTSPDFVVRFRPDTPRLNRDGHTKIWCEVQRKAGFKGEASLSLVDLPKGVKVNPIIVGPGNNYSSVFTIEAAADAPLGVFPLKLQATVKMGEKSVKRLAIAEAGKKTLKQAYITVLDRAALAVGPVGPPSDDQLKNQETQLVKLEAQLSADTAELTAAQAVWEKKLASTKDLRVSLGVWNHIGPFKGRSVNDAFNKVFAPEKNIELTKTYPGGLKWVKQKPWKDGVVINPWSAPNASNYIYRTIEVAAPRKLPLSLGSDDGIKVFINGKQVLANNIGRGAAADQEKVTIDLKEGVNHLLMKIVNGGGGSGFYFRADAKTTGIPASITAIAKIAPDKRNDQQKKQIKSYYRTIAPSLVAVRQKIASIKDGSGAQIQINRLRKSLVTPTPTLAAEQAKWEPGTLKNFGGWSVLSFKEMKSQGGARFNPPAEGAIRVNRAVTPKDTYTLVSQTPLRVITAVRLEALAAPKLPGGGPGLADNGNFVLTEFKVTAAPISDPGSAKPVTLSNPKSTFNQGSFPIAHTIDGKNNTGWAIAGQTAKSHTAMWMIKKPIDIEGGAQLVFSMEHQSVHAKHIIGKFRISVSSAAKPNMKSKSLPAGVIAALRTPKAKRNKAQAERLATFYRTIAPSLQPIRDQIAQKQALLTPYPPVLVRNKTGKLAVRVDRRGAFKGDVRLTIEGFSSGRDPKTQAPNVFGKNIEFKPVTLKGDQTVAVLTFKAKGNSEVGTRNVVIRAEAKVGNETVVQYSPAIPLTVKAK